VGQDSSRISSGMFLGAIAAVKCKGADEHIPVGAIYKCFSFTRSFDRTPLDLAVAERRLVASGWLSFRYTPLESIEGWIHAPATRQGDGSVQSEIASFDTVSYFPNI
jgi:hypothetical protein